MAFAALPGEVLTELANYVLEDGIAAWGVHCTSLWTARMACKFLARTFRAAPRGVSLLEASEDEREPAFFTAAQRLLRAVDLHRVERVVFFDPHHDSLCWVLRQCPRLETLTLDFLYSERARAQPAEWLAAAPGLRHLRLNCLPWRALVAALPRQPALQLLAWYDEGQHDDLTDRDLAVLGPLTDEAAACRLFPNGFSSGPGHHGLYALNFAGVTAGGLAAFCASCRALTTLRTCHFLREQANPVDLWGAYEILCDPRNRLETLELFKTPDSRRPSVVVAARGKTSQATTRIRADVLALALALFFAPDFDLGEGGGRRLDGT
jgi:hypothetical protein